ncbi:hypothetical protein HK405_015185, partial [Cladochytrium tenue]
MSIIRRLSSLSLGSVDLRPSTGTVTPADSAVTAHLESADHGGSAPGSAGGPAGAGAGNGAAGRKPASSEVYLRVHLPNDSTTVIMVDGGSTFWEILNVIAVKKELLPALHVLRVRYLDGREEEVPPEKILATYQNVDCVKV